MQNVNLGRLIREYRKNDNLVQMQFAELFDINDKQVSYMETGAISVPLDFLIKFMEHYKLTLEDIFGEDRRKYLSVEVIDELREMSYDELLLTYEFLKRADNITNPD